MEVLEDTSEGVGGDSGLAPPTMRLSCADHQRLVLERMNTVRRNGGQFCDAVLEVAAHTWPVHRAVLACVSKHLLHLFNTQPDTTHFVLDNIADHASVQHLINYAYTARLEVPEDKVNAVYKAAIQLKMRQAANQCADYMVKRLNPQTCLGSRSFASSCSDRKFTSKIDRFIQQNIGQVLECAEVHTLPCLQVDIVGTNDLDLTQVNELNISKLIVNWAEDSLHEHSTESIYDHKQVLYLMSDNSLCDCLQVADSDNSLKNSDIVQDYKKLKSKLGQVSTLKPKNGSSTQPPPPTPPRSHRGSTDSLYMEPETNTEWSVIASHRVDEKHFICIAMFNDQMSRISAHVRLLPPSPQPDGLSSKVNIESQQTAAEFNQHHLFSREKSISFTPLCPMSSARSYVGLATLDNKLIAMGGYDRGECLATVEAFDLETNQWSPLADMHSARGRFAVSQIGGKLYACGGSDGLRDLDTVEQYDPSLGCWQAVEKMLELHSCAGVAALNEKLYVIGGISGQQTLNSCEEYDSTKNEWKFITPLQTRRQQAGVCVFEEKIFAVGGCDAWNCYNTVECYSPNEDKWAFMPPLSTPRRGAGVASFKGQLYVVGGSDGQNALSSTEIFNPKTWSWSFGPSLSHPRANVGVISLHNRLFAVGGFCKNSFLDSIEFLDAVENEWSSYLPKQSYFSHEENPLEDSNKAELNGYGSEHSNHETSNSEIDSIASGINKTCISNISASGDAPISQDSLSKENKKGFRSSRKKKSSQTHIEVS